MATFDTRLKKLRQEKGILQDTLAEDIGVTKGTVSVWERGIRKPDFDTLEKLAGYFDVTLPYLLGDSEYINSQEIADEDAAPWATEDDDEHLTTMAKQYARLSMSRDVSSMARLLRHIRMICRQELFMAPMSIP